MEREDKPSLRCKGRCQGFHQTCYDRLEIGPSLAELPGEFSWLCTVCAPLYELKTVLGGSKGQEKPRLRRYQPVVSQPVTGQQLLAAQVDGAGQGEGQGGGVDSTGGVGASESQSATIPAADQSLVTPVPPPLPNSVTSLPASDSVGDSPAPGAGISSQDCALYLSGVCPFGISGKTGGMCPDRHPKRCMPYMKWGNKSDKGCSGITCGKSHPTLCPKSLDLKCFDTQCPWKLHTHFCMRADRGVGRKDQGWNEWVRVGRRGNRGARDQRSSGQRSTRDRQGWVGPPGRQGGTGAAPQGWVGPPGRQGGAAPQGWFGPPGRQGGAVTASQGWVGPTGRQGGAALQGGQVGAGTGHLQQPSNHPQASPWVGQGFQEMTAQQNLLGALEQQLQQTVTRAILQALSGAVPGLGVSNASPSSS